MKIFSLIKKSFFAKIIVTLTISLSAFAVMNCDSSKDQNATLKIISPAQNAEVYGSDFELKVKTTNFTYAVGAVEKISAAQSSIKGGHVHVFMDTPVSEVNELLTMHEDSVRIFVEGDGWHYIIVTGADSSHTPVTTMRDSVKFHVNFPAN